MTYFFIRNFRRLCGVFCLCFFVGRVCAGPMSLDFVDTPIADVVRAISLAYDTPILVDDHLEKKVTFHLDGVGVLEGLTALCDANGLMVVQSGGVFHVRAAVSHGVHDFSRQDSLVSVSVKDKDVVEFIREFSLNSGLNILATPEVSGTVSGDLRNLSAESAFRLLMKANGFRVWREESCLRVDRIPKNQQKEGDAERLTLLRDGELYSAEVNGADLLTVLKKVAEEARLNLAVYGNVSETVHLSFRDVALDVLLDALLKGRRLSYELQQGTLRVSEAGASNVLAAAELYSLRHVHSEKALAYLQKMNVSANFTATEIKEQNALYLMGSAANIESAKRLLQKIDVPALQVALACIIVEFKRGKGFEIGLHSGSTRKTAANDIGVRGFWDFSATDASASGTFGRVGLLPDRFELELAAMEENNEAEILARPKLTTINGNKAELNVTNTVYYLVSQVSADGYPITDYRSFNDGISLELTPTVTQNGSITLEVSPEIKTAGRSSGDGPRDISTRNLKTVVVLKDGETLCLGGLIRKSKSEVRSAVPFLGSIPFVGRIFSYVSEEEEENELAIFITPQVLTETAGDSAKPADVDAAATETGVSSAAREMPATVPAAKEMPATATATNLVKEGAF